MKILKLAVKNTRSFGEEVELSFDKAINIFIGPNAGGKSNLLDILNISLIEFLLFFWRIRIDRSDNGAVTRRILIKEGLFGQMQEALDSHNQMINQPQEIRISLSPDIEDLTNLKIILKHNEALLEFREKNISYAPLPNLLRFDSEDIKEADIEAIKDKTFIFGIKNSKEVETYPRDEAEHREYHIFLNYLNNFDVYSQLIDTYNELNPEKEEIPKLHPPVCYFSPYRAPQIQGLVTKLSGNEKHALKTEYRKATSKVISSTLNFANFHFGSKLRLLNNNLEAFQSDEEVKLINKYLKILGYKQFTYSEVDPLNNTYQGKILKQNGDSLEVSKASSGEKEVLNLLLGVFAFNIKNGIIIIDEPELHLHPKWQITLLELFTELSRDRGIQFFLSTHSPHFVTQKSIKSVCRIFLKEGQSRVCMPGELNETEKDLYQFIDVLNNTKVFFADKVILVEGTVDQIIFDSILNGIQSEKRNNEVIEILDIAGKNNLNKFQRFLRKWAIQCYILADRGFTPDDSESSFVLSKDDIQEYFDGISKRKFGIDEALKVAKGISNQTITIPEEIRSILIKIVENQNKTSRDKEVEPLMN